MPRRFCSARCSPQSLPQPTNLARYFTHEAVLDSHGVIAPWYHGLNGQCDCRVIAAETLELYPWTIRTNVIAQYPAAVFSSFRPMAASRRATRRIEATAI